MIDKMSNSVFLIKISERELEKFEKYIEEGKTVDNHNLRELERKGIRIEDFRFVDGKIRFWTFTKNLGIKKDDNILFLIDDILYIFKTSWVIKDEEVTKILECYDEIEIPFIVLLKPRQSKYKCKINSSIKDYLFKECEEIEENIFKCKINLDDLESKLISLGDFLESKGYKFPDYLIAQFYTALKTKGFVILSGLSGTGKTKIALNFAKLLERKLLKGKEIEKLEEFMTSSGRNFDPKGEIEALRKTIKSNGFAVKYFDYKGELSKSDPPIVLWIYNAMEGTETYQKVVMGLLITDIGEYSYNTLPENWKKGIEWIQKVYHTDLRTELKDNKLCVKIKDVWDVKVDIAEFRDKDSGRNLSTGDASRMGKGFIRVKSPEGLIPIERNYIFLPVRPDWRDSKPLLGYYNPLDKKYYKTSLLDLILNAEKNYRENKDRALPCFIILDEMNLARVEYYFADFLSVLESGRDNDGFTRESIKLHDVDEVEKGQGIPKEIRLPPNIYIVGTVNIDETTYMFSPKVLDRAFVIEFHDVDMDGYPPPFNETQEYSDLKERILEDLRGKDGKFLAYSDKRIINEAIEELNAEGYWAILQKLNKALEPFDLHFGYRVIDEIALFFKKAKESMDKGIIHFESYDEIFDLALLMKILPKFHGNKRKLERPLLLILKVVKDGNLTDENIKNHTKDLLKYVFSQYSEENVNVSDLIIENLKCLEGYKFKHTAKKVLRMLRQLYDTGFASFS